MHPRAVFVALLRPELLRKRAKQGIGLALSGQLELDAADLGVVRIVDDLATQGLYQHLVAETGGEHGQAEVDQLAEQLEHVLEARQVSLRHVVVPGTADHQRVVALQGFGPRQALGQVMRRELLALEPCVARETGVLVLAHRIPGFACAQEDDIQVLHGRPGSLEPGNAG